MFDYDYGDECPDCKVGEKCGYIGYSNPTDNTIECYGDCYCLTKPFCPTLIQSFQFPLDNICVGWYFYFIILLPSMIF